MNHLYHLQIIKNVAFLLKMLLYMIINLMIFSLKNQILFKLLQTMDDT